MNDSDEDSFVVNTGAKAKSKRRSRLPTNSQRFDRDSTI